VTEKEANLLAAIVESDFHNGNDPIDNPVWRDDVLDNLSDAAVLGSLIKKGLAGSDDVDKPRDACCWVTSLGMSVYEAGKEGAA
jgi:hypothetical protein